VEGLVSYSSGVGIDDIDGSYKLFNGCCHVQQGQLVKARGLLTVARVATGHIQQLVMQLVRQWYVEAPDR
jgi:hypothetical protein